MLPNGQVRITFPYLVNTLEFKRTKMVREATEYDLQGRKQWTKNTATFKFSI